VKLGVGDIRCLQDDWRLLVKEGFSLEDSLKVVTSNPAKRTGLFDSKGSLAAGKDADLLILNGDLGIETVLAKGRVLVDRGKALIKGTFE